MSYAISELNQMSQAQFVVALGGIFEATPAIAAQAWRDRPFANVIDLHQKMVAAMQALSDVEKRDLICAHPDLGSRLKMAAASVQEQAGAGLDRLSPAEFERFQALNSAYKKRFGFPFIIAVRHHTRDSILQAFTQRLQHSLETEAQQALTEIMEIARLRLQDAVS